MKGICPHRSFLVGTSVSLLFNLSLSLSLVAHLFVLFLFKILIYLKGRDRAHPSIITLPRCLPQLGLGQAEARHLEICVSHAMVGTPILELSSASQGAH